MSDQIRDGLAPVAPPTEVNRLAYIDTLRGFAALWVFMLHTHQYWLSDVKPSGLNPTRIITFFFGMGGLGVDLFIVLSGFCLFYPLVKSSKTMNVNFDVLKFYRRRAFRLLPAYYAALALLIVLISIPAIQPKLVGRPLNFADIATHLFLLQTFSNHTIGSINGPFWSIALEAQLYLVFPLLILVYKRRGMAPLLGIGLGAAILWPFIYAGLAKAGMNFTPHYHLLARWIEFIIGMLAAKIVCHHLTGSKKWSALAFVLTLPVTVALNTGIADRLGAPAFIGTTVAGITFAALVVFLANFRNSIFAGKNPLGVLNRIGVISYSVYLLHQPIILLLNPWAQSLKLGIIPTFGLALVTSFPLALLMGWLFFTFIERPFIALGKRRKAPIAVGTQTVADQAIP